MQLDDNGSSYEYKNIRHESLTRSASLGDDSTLLQKQSSTIDGVSITDSSTTVFHVPSIDSVCIHTGYPPPPTACIQARDCSISINLTGVNTGGDQDKLVQQSYSSTKHVTQDGDQIIFSKFFIKRAIVMCLWFFMSFTGIVLNKYILTGLDVDPGILGECQILMTTVFGAIMMYIPYFGLRKNTVASPRHEYFSRYQFFKTILILGWLRCGAIICSVIALKYVAVSFSETVKSSAPLFTAITAYLVIGEYSGLYVNLSLVPIMFGLAISTSTELSFNVTGFTAAIVNNILDCIQNVFSKKLLSGEDHRFSPLELQFYTSVAASVVQMPFWFFFLDIHEKLYQINQYTATMLFVNGVVFYSQSLLAYLLMSYISPVTFSVSNTVKRACLIWFSVIVFNNKVSAMSAFGTVLVVCGVFLYQRARHIEGNKRKSLFNEQKHDGRSKAFNT